MYLTQRQPSSRAPDRHCQVDPVLQPPFRPGCRPHEVGPKLVRHQGSKYDGREGYRGGKGSAVISAHPRSSTDETSVRWRWSDHRRCATFRQSNSADSVGRTSHPCHVGKSPAISPPYHALIISCFASWWRISGNDGKRLVSD